MRIGNSNNVKFQSLMMNKQLSKDTFSKNIQNQIENAQKQLQELSENKSMSSEEKMKKRQEIRQLITDLNNQLRQHEVELRKEQQIKIPTLNNMVNSTSSSVSKSKGRSLGLSHSTMNAIISVNTSLMQIQVQGGVMRKMEGRSGVLQSEIKLDSSRGINVDAKTDELTKVQQRINQIEATQTQILTDVNKEFESTYEEDIADKTDKDKKTSNKKINTKDENKDIKEEIRTINLISKDDEETTSYLTIDVHA
ncbi:MAG: FlxA-like family protein [Erysipelotrichales bacterium]|nr:FlxA-like family protein [Erysipelotrichales bacterium]